MATLRPLLSSIAFAIGTPYASSPRRIKRHAPKVRVSQTGSAKEKS
jgi:hypothetical protein